MQIKEMKYSVQKTSMLEDQVKTLKSELKQSQMSKTIVMNEINDSGQNE